MTARSPRALAAMTLAAAASLPAAAQELTWSTYGTIGVTRSNRDFHYQRFINDEGSASRDTVFGMQADLRLNPQWSATAQLKLAPSLKHESRWDLTPAWAFVAWRPDNDWLVRAGRLRMPLYLYSESLDLGQTHDMARLPTELYAIIPVPDFDGAYVSRNWALGDSGDSDLTLDVFGGKTSATARLWYRDGLPPAVQPGSAFWSVDVRLGGLALTLRQRDLLVRSSLTRTVQRRYDGSGFAVRYPQVTLGPGLSYYQVDPSLPGPGIPTTPRIRNTMFSIGAEVGLGQGWRVTGEVVRNLQHDTAFGADATAGYLAVFKQIERFTPYVSVSRLKSRPLNVEGYQQLTEHPLPDFIPGAAQLNAAQRVAAESFWVAEQRSVAVGTAYALSPAVKLKGEWLHSRIGRVSRLVDTPPGQPTPQHTGINVLTLNLSYAF